MANLAVGLAKSVVEGTLSKAQAAIAEEGKLRNSAQCNLVFITEEFQMMQSFLRVANTERVENPVVITWVRQIRELAYDVEDCIEFVAHLDKKSHWWWRMLPSGCVPAPQPLDEAIHEIEQLKARVEDVSTRNARYSLISDTGSKPVIVQQQEPLPCAAVSTTKLNMLAEARGATKRNQHFGDLTELITKKSSSLQVISVWGSGCDHGHGTTSIIRKTYDDPGTCRHFPCRACVKLMHPFSPHEFVRSLMAQFYASFFTEQREPIGREVLIKMKATDEDLFRELEQLTEKRYLVVLEGLSNMAEWDVIRTFLPAKENGSWIIVSTQQCEIATLCIGDFYQILELRKISDEHSVCAHFKVSRKYGRSVPWTNAVVVELEQLVSKCGGFPKVIAEIGSSVGSILETRMNNARARHARALSNNFMNVLETDPKFHSLQDLFGWIRAYFRTCPDSLKPCIHYLSIFRQDKIIRRRQLVRRWIAEGYSRDNHEESAEENGEKQFSNLLDQSIIQQPPQKIATPSLGNTRMVLCQVNCFVHEYIVSRRMEESFVFELGKNCALTTQRTGRHLIILEDWDRDKIVFRSTDFSRLRSLTVLGKWESFFISKSMKILRVLDLEDAWGMKDSDVEMMVKLLPRLKFLSLRGCCGIFHLPSSLGDLRQLQTLDVRGTSIVTLPENITELQKLQYIRAGSGTKEKTSGKLNVAASAPAVSSCWLPKFSKCHQLVGVVVPGAIGKLTTLHTLGVVNVGDSRWRPVLEELKKLTQLRKLGVSGINKKNGKELFSAIEGCVHLESLSVQLNKDNEFCLDGIPMPLENLRSLKLYGLVSVKLSEWSDRLSKLTKLHLEIATLTEDDARFLSRLPQLCILRVKQLQDGELQFRVIEDGEEKYSFGWVKVLQIACGCSTSSLHVTFGSKAMKKLELLKVDCCGEALTYQFSGLENLEELKQVLLLNSSNAQALKEQLESQLAQHPSLVKPVVKLEEPPRSSASISSAQSL